MHIFLKSQRETSIGIISFIQCKIQNRKRLHRLRFNSGAEYVGIFVIFPWRRTRLCVSSCWIFFPLHGEGYKDLPNHLTFLRRSISPWIQYEIVADLTVVNMQLGILAHRLKSRAGNRKTICLNNFSHNVVIFCVYTLDKNILNIHKLTLTLQTKSLHSRNTIQNNI